MSENRKFDLTSYARAKERMIATNENAYSRFGQNLRQRDSVREYSTEEIERIITSGSVEEQQKLSRNYFALDGYYKQIIIHYATLLKYAGILIANPGFGNKLSSPAVQKKYYQAMDYVEKMSLPILCSNFAWRALIDGCYYGARVDLGKKGFQVIDLPVGYACSRFKDFKGNDVVEFDLRYFDKILLDSTRNEVLESYPKFISKAYRKWSKKRSNNSWIILPEDVGVCFPFFDGRPLFLSVIPATIAYDNAMELEKERAKSEIRKILVQEIPHLSDGRLVFEPEEAAEMHSGAVDMMKGNKNLSVLTSYGKVSAIGSESSAMGIEATLNRYEQNIYSQAGVTGQILSGQGSSSFEASLNNDTALMMSFANKVGLFVSNILNNLFGNSAVSFKYTFLPITYHNETTYLDNTYKILGSGFSAIMPALTFGLSQRDLINIKDLENDVLKLGDKLKPLQTAYTQSGEPSEQTKKSVDTEKALDKGGRPQKKQQDKNERTLANEKSKDKTGG